MSDRRLIEAAFPLQRVSEDSVHEKNVRHGHISTLHIWPARRPLAASRAVILSTLLPDPGDEAGRGEALRRMAGYDLEIRDEEGEIVSKVWRGGIFHWGSENEEELERFRGEIRKAFSGRAPRVLDPFAGGGAIPLEAMRLGCEVEAADLNPVAWFILRCTLHYPTLVAGKSLPVPEIGSAGRGAPPVETGTGSGPADDGTPAAATTEGNPGLWRSDEAPESKAFPVHLRVWGRRVLAGARRELASRYPIYADFEPVRRKGRRRAKEIPYERRPMRLLEPDREGAVRAAVAGLNAEFGRDYLASERNPRWVEKPTVAYLWTRTVECAGCRAEIPLLKTRWLCRKSGKRVLLTMTPREDEAGVVFGVDKEAGEGEGNAAARREHDRRLGAGTMSRRGATCPCCGAVATMRDLRAAGRAGRLGERMTAVVVNGQRGKEYRLPTEVEIEASRVTEEELEALYADIPFGLPAEPTPKAGIGASRAFSVDGYGFDTWRKLFTSRQLLAIGTLIRQIRQCAKEIADEYPPVWHQNLAAYLSCVLSRQIGFESAMCSWNLMAESVRNTFARFALPMVWDFAEVNPLANGSVAFAGSTDWIVRVLDRLEPTMSRERPATVVRRSATETPANTFDLICTDPPYYDSIPYSDLMDLFHIWLRRTLHGVSEETDGVFASILGPKWDQDRNDGELIDDANRFDGSRKASKKNYEDGMARCFGRFRTALRDDGRFVVVFASKDPNAWETLVSAIIRAGFVVTASWPIQTERAARQRSLSSAALASSIWLVCRKRPAAARSGWDSRVLSEMRTNITKRLHEFWDAGLRGPDFVWAATGPALEAFSHHPFVRKEDSTTDETMSVAEFLKQVRRMVVGFAVGRLLRLTGKGSDPDDSGPSGDEGSGTEALDDPTTYYLLHRNDFGLEPAPAGACILYALSCGLSDTDLAGRLDLLSRKQGRGSDDEDDDDGEGGEGGQTSGDKARLKPWNRRRKDVGLLPGADGSPPPLVDCAHRAMRLWKEGDRGRVDAYLNERGLPHNELFRRVVQAVLELAEKGSEERAILESLQQHEPSDTAVAAPTSTRPRSLFT